MTQTSAPVTKAAPISSWLLPGGRGTRLRLNRAVSQAAGREEQARRIRVLGAVARKALVEEITVKLRMVLNDTLADLVVGGWRAHSAVQAAIRKSRQQPGVDQVLSLRNHTIKADREHVLDVKVDDVVVITLTARLEVSLRLQDAVAVVRDGHLITARSGQAHATASLSVEDVTIAKRTLAFPLAAELTLRPQPNMTDRPDAAALG